MSEETEELENKIYDLLVEECIIDLENEAGEEAWNALLKEFSEKAMALSDKFEAEDGD